MFLGKKWVMAKLSESEAEIVHFFASGGGSGASWWSGRGRTDRLIDLPPKSRSISSGMHMTK